MPMLTLTPIIVRGKRKGEPCEKWSAKKRRQQPDRLSSGSAGGSWSLPKDVDQQASKTRRKRRKAELSRLEQLPPEMIQHIFELSENLNLPIASTVLAEQLSDAHMFKVVASNVLKPLTNVVSGRSAESAGTPTDEEVTKAARLLSCRFCTWNFFSSWLHDFYGRYSEVCRKSGGSVEATIDKQHAEADMWTQLGGCLIRPLPTKLLVGPWTDDKASFLQFLVPKGSDGPILLAAQQEAAYEGYQSAIEEHRGDLMTVFSRMLEPDVELLRKAVIDDGCDKRIVAPLLIQLRQRECLDASENALLDPAIWAWADRAKADGDGNGEWLLDFIKLLRDTRDDGLTHGRPYELAEEYGVEGYVLRVERERP